MLVLNKEELIADECNRTRLAQTQQGGGRHVPSEGVFNEVASSTGMNVESK